MSTPTLRTGQRKNAPTFGGFTPGLGRGISLGPVLCLCGAYFEVASSLAQRKNGQGVRGLAPPNVLGGQPSALLALLTAGNCRNPYRDTVENASTLGKPDIHDPQLDPNPLKPTPIFWNFGPSRKARSDRLCRPL